MFNRFQLSIGLPSAVVAPAVVAGHRAPIVCQPSGRVESLPALTGLRGFACLWVLLQHLDMALNAGGLRNLPFLYEGYLGVDIFFILSGFVLVHVYGRAPSADLKFCKGFLKARLARIYPLHLASLLALVVISQLSQPFRDQFSANPAQFAPGKFV